MSIVINVSFAQDSIKKIDEDRIIAFLSKLPTSIKVSMSVENTDGKSFFEHRPDVRVPSASVIKIPILMALMEKVAKNEVNLDKLHTLTTAEKTGGSGVLMNFAEGKQLTIRAIAQEMIRTSDNTATNILIKEIGMDFINQNLAKLNITKTHLNRIMMDTEAVKQGRENYVNTHEINTLLRLIFNKKVATPQLCDEMLEMLKSCEDTTTIPRNLPQSLIIAHKTGTLDYIRGDAGIVYTNKPFIISIFVEGFQEISSAEQIIGDIAKICWESLK
jgi:beta-lactamase class A